MAVIKTLTEDGVWAYISVDGSNADTLDGKHASEFATNARIDALVASDVDAMPRILDSSLYGSVLPTAGTTGRIFFLKKV